MCNKPVLQHIVYALTLLAFLYGCSENPPPETQTEPEVLMRVFRQFEIPVFPTAWEQLNYAKSGFNNIEKRKAAYEIIPLLFPDDLEACGNSALYSAYLNLGQDYRFAENEQVKKAAKAYEQIVLIYKDHPNILAKAHWYLGWLYTDLLGKKSEGLKHFFKIIDTFPDIPMGITPPVPWVSLVYPEHTGLDHSKQQKVSTPWGSAALLEIIRHSEDKTTILDAFNLLWDSYSDTAPVAPALLILLKNKDLREDALPFAEEFLAAESTANPYLSEEIRHWSAEN